MSEDQPDSQTFGSAGERRTAFTWRLTEQQATGLDKMVLQLRIDLGYRLDRATALAGMYEITAGNPAIYAVLREHLASTHQDPQQQDNSRARLKALADQADPAKVARIAAHVEIQLRALGPATAADTPGVNHHPHEEATAGG